MRMKSMNNLKQNRSCHATLCRSASRGVASRDREDASPYSGISFFALIGPFLEHNSAVYIDPADPSVSQSERESSAFSNYSVRTMEPTVSPNIYWSAITPDAGEIPGDW